MNDATLEASRRWTPGSRGREGADSFMLEQPSARNASDEVLSLLAHELRTPLANVICWAALLKSKLTPAQMEVRRGLDIILSSARAQSRMIDEVLDSRRLELGKVTLQPQWLTLSTFVDQIVVSHSAAAGAAGLSLCVETGGTCGSRIWADPVRLMQILANLLSNAIKFTPHGGTIECSTRIAGTECAITVRDNGCGIPSRSLSHIFESFYQGESARGAGLGLGLAVVRQLVVLHGGRVEAESEGAGKGAAFTVWLPSCQPAE